ncbi:cobalt ECF transporter T component CbiQ [Alkaliphilus peptidifermentans]|uniref:Cobalt/nickel transport system permease protein n=1 Tax=Alkaliphilus peptidifermentans DSM 18978 TaxID=1120976 RepID=A0A1G5ARA9_9FIRM|nr:cobalt ECF transporter T component CbiQ [Alkaliphilus peptidifermentans]SCX80412.1 cobalt/nickel transport system permease protein [Alkaliphilus peptidifermentans DSM 18978]
MSVIDEIAYKNQLRTHHPMEKFFFALITLVIGLISSSVIPPIIILAVMGCLVIYKGKVSYKVYIKLMLLPSVFLILGIIPILLSIQIHSISSIKVSIPKDGLSIAGFLIIRALASTTCLYFLILSTPITEILYVLKKIKVPILLREIMFLMYRFIFLYIDTANKIYIAQKSRGGYSKLKASYYSISQLIIMLFLKSSYRGHMTYKALKARGYDGELKAIELEYQASRKNWVIIAVFEILLLTITLKA